MPVGKNVHRHWSRNVRDVSIAHDGLNVRIEGGAENGEFLYVGAFTSEQIKHRRGRLRLGDILIEMNDEAVVGWTLQDLMNRINQVGKKVSLKVVEPGGGISKDLRNFLAQEFSNTSEVDLDLQDVIRDNLYARTVPCTTRSPKSREEPGIDYIFVSKEKFQEMLKNGDFLESGTYNGHFYGTLKPSVNVNWSEGLLGIEGDAASPLPVSHQADKEETTKEENITVHRETVTLNDGDQNGNQEVNNNKNKNKDKKTSDNHIINV